MGVVGLDEPTRLLVVEAWEKLKKITVRTSKLARRTTAGGSINPAIELSVVSLPDRSSINTSSRDYTSEAYSAIEVVLTREIKKHKAHNKMWTANGLRAEV